MKKCFLSMAACLAVTMLVGCGTSQGLIRGQSPTVTQTSSNCKTCQTDENSNGSVIEGEYCDECGEEISEAEYLLKGYWLHELFQPLLHPPMLLHAPRSDAPRSAERRQQFKERVERVRRGEPALPPTYEHNYRVYRPRNLKYPSQNSPGAVVQYPYYTHKGPDDFFLGKEDFGI